MSDVAELRIEAAALVRKDEGSLIRRSCWNCNGAHEHLRHTSAVVISCFCCERFYFRGTDITEDVDGLPECGCFSGQREGDEKTEPRT